MPAHHITTIIFSIIPATLYRFFQVKATRRAGPAPVVTPFRGDEQDDVVAVSKSAGANPFKKDKIVSKFDVSDIRKVEFVGSYVDDESAWPKVQSM